MRITLETVSMATVAMETCTLQPVPSNHCHGVAMEGVKVMGVILIQPIKFIFSSCLSCDLFTYYQVTKLFRNPTNGPN